MSLSSTELPEDNQGACVPKQFIENFSPHYLDICDCPESSRWDCCITISSEQCNLREQFPAYFTYLVGHEIGHARICLEDIGLHKHCCLIDSFIYYASGSRIQPSESPHEQLFDKFGKYLSSKLHDPNKIGHEIEEKLSLGIDKDTDRLVFIRDTYPSDDFSGLREKLLVFSRPYKNELLECWNEDIQINGERSLVKLVENYDKLFE